MEKYNIFNKKSDSLINILIFELRSWYGRHIQKRNTKITANRFNEPRLLDLGVGANYSDGWINADFFRSLHLRFWKKRANVKANELELDLRFPIPCEDNIIDGVYSGHTLEHFTPLDALNILSEIFRILKPGCWLRINVPDLKKCVDYYNGNKPNYGFDLFNSGCECIHGLTQDSGHLSVWDNELLGKLLSDVGFVNVKVVKFGKEGIDKRLIKEENIREWVTLVMEAQKSVTI